MKERNELKMVIVEDNDLKAQNVFGYLINQDIMEIERFSTMNPALSYIIGNQKEISGIILDLGFDSFEDSFDYNEYKGLELANELKRKNIDIPILIYSSTEVSEYDMIPSIYDQMLDFDTKKLEGFIQFLVEKG